MNKEISQAVIRRLPRYYRYLGELLDRGVERISSGELSDIMHVTASQIRQDLNNFGGFGQQGYGYYIPKLHEAIGEILGIDKVYNVIILGAGNLGQALAGYSNFESMGFKVVALFDIDKRFEGKSIRGIPVYMTDKLEDFIRDNDVDIATLTLPKHEAEAAAHRLVECGIRAIWNFALVDLNIADKDVVIENVHLSDSLMQLSYNISKAKK